MENNEELLRIIEEKIFKAREIEHNFEKQFLSYDLQIQELDSKL